MLQKFAGPLVGVGGACSLNPPLTRNNAVETDVAGVLAWWAASLYSTKHNTTTKTGEFLKTKMVWLVWELILKVEMSFKSNL